MAVLISQVGGTLCSIVRITSLRCLGFLLSVFPCVSSHAPLFFHVSSFPKTTFFHSDHTGEQSSVWGFFLTNAEPRPFSERMQENAQTLVDKLVKPRFPLTTVDAGAQLIVDILSTEPEPPLAVICLLCELIQAALWDGSSRKARGKMVKLEEERSAFSIPWSQFDGAWKNLLTVLRRNFPLVTTRNRSAVVTKPLDAASRVRQIFACVGGTFSLRAGTGAGAGALSNFIASSLGQESGRKFPLPLADLKMISVIIAQLIGVENVHLSLSECLSYVRVDNGPRASENGSVSVPGLEDGLLPIGFLPTTGPPIHPRDLWVCSQQQFIHCDRFMEVAYLCIRLSGIDSRSATEPVAALQRHVLAHLYQNGHLEMYPLAMAAHGRLQVLRASSPEEIDGGEQALLGAVEVSRKFFRNAFLLPYSFLFDHLLSTETNRVSALLPAFLASDVVKQYRYVVSLDKHLNDELLGKMATQMEHIICKDRGSKELLHDPTVAGLVLGFIDNICLWEEKSSADIWHSTWTQKLIKSCLHRLAEPIRRHVMLHGSAASMRAVVEPVAHDDYVSEMLRELRNSSPSVGGGSLISEEEEASGPKATFLPPELLTEDFCQFAMGLYEKWPPLRLDTLGESFLHKERLEMIAGEIPTVEDVNLDTKKCRSFVETLRGWPQCAVVSDEDLDRIREIREINPLYRPWSKQVFPFLDMGPQYIPIFAFDFEKIKREIKVPHGGTVESGIIFEMQRHLSGRDSERPLVFSHVLLRSQKMLSIQPLLEQEKFNQSEIALKLEGNQAGGVAGGPREKRERKPSTKMRVK